MSVSVQAQDFDAGQELAQLGAGKPQIGAVVSFIGLVRNGQDDARSPEICDMTLEYYPGMTEKALERIVAEASSRWPLQAVRVIHRYGQLAVGAQIVFVAVATRHRGEAFQACEFIMDYLKTEAPFWKKEAQADGSGHWVDARDSDDQALNKWQ